MDVEFKKGQHVSFTLYMGNNKVEADTTFKFLEDARIHDTILPLNGSGTLIDYLFKIKILKVYRIDPTGDGAHYQVFADGVLE